MIKASKILRVIWYRYGYLLIAAAWMFTIAFAISNYGTLASKPAKLQASFESYLSKRENLFDQIIGDKNSLAILLNSQTDKSALQISDADFGLFVFRILDSNRVSEEYWSSFNMNLNASDLNTADGFYPFNGSNGFFELLKKTVQYNNTNYVVAALIPIKWNYLIENKYLVNSFANAASLSSQFYIADGGNGYPVYNSQGKKIFSFDKTTDNANFPNIWTVAFICAAILFILIFINNTIGEIAVRKGLFAGSACLIAAIIAMRIISYTLPIPFNFRNYDLFSPLIYASSLLHSSLGDLLINVLLIFWITTFVKRHYSNESLKKMSKFFAKRRKIWSVAALFLFAFVTLFCVDIICSFVLDSKIPLTVTNFFHLNFYTVIALCIFTFIVLSYFNFSYFIFTIVKRYSLLWKIAVAVVSALIVIALKRPADTLFIQLAAVIWLVVYLLILQFREKDLPHTISASPYFLFWLMFFAASITAAIKATKSNETEHRLRIAEDVAVQTDSEGQFLLKMTTGNFGSFLTGKNFMRFYADDENAYLKDSLTINNFQDFTNKYQINIYTFDSLRNPLYNRDSTSFADLNALVNNSRPSANLPDFYWYKNKNEELNYVYRKKIAADSSAPVSGYFFMWAQSNQFADNASPNELLQGSWLSDDDENYAYAIYKNGTLVRSNSNDYEFSDTISPKPIPINGYREINNKKIRELWYNAGNNFVIIVAQKNVRFIDDITLFAYVFLAFTILIILIQVVNFIIRSRFKWRIMRRSFNFKMRTQIHITLIFISLFSFVIIGISTISFFILRYNKDRQDNLIKNLQVLANEIQSRANAQSPFISSPTNYTERAIEIADINSEDINLYSKDGLLQATSQPYIYNQNIASNRMQPEAFYQMRYRHRINFLQRETIGKFWYLSGYTPLYDDNKNVIAYLNIPSFRSQTALEQEISGFLVTIINLNALIFLLAGAIAALFTLRITKSYAYIKDEMKKINVDIENKEIEWKQNDEMGDLVREYNIMVKKLNKSVKALAQSEREGAWKQMARQVAHEIKNPLTPMKLNLQFLERAAQDETYDIRSLSKKLPIVLIEQINQLAKIADDFSQFANIYNIHPELFNLTELLEGLITLYRTNNRMIIHFTKSEEKIMLYTDKTQINRVFTNLLKNAFEASEEREFTEIFIDISRVENKVQVSIKDNGCGISSEQADKIFTPNFTTKSSGMGLGLAICKAIVENADGQIRFTSEENKGTTFFVTLPVKGFEAV